MAPVPATDPSLSSPTAGGISPRALERMMRALRTCASGCGWEAITLVVDHDDAVVLTWPATALRDLATAAAPGRRALGSGQPVTRTLTEPLADSAIAGCVAVPVGDSVLPAAVTGWLDRTPAAEDVQRAETAASMLEGPLRRALAPRQPWDAIQRLGPQLDRLPAGIACLDETGRIRTWSAPLAMLVGISAETAVGHTPAELGLGPEGHLLDAGPALLPRLRARGGECTFELVHPTSRGPVPCAWTLSTVGSDAGVTAVVRRRDAPPAPLRAAGQISAGALAHELNNVVASILLNAELLDASLAPASPGVRRLLGRLMGSTERAARLGTLLLMGSGCTGFGRETVDLAELAAGVVDEARGGLPAATRLRLRCEGGAAIVRSDRRQLLVVVRALLDNALGALPGGAGRVDVVVDLHTLEAGEAGRNGLSRPGRYARLTVTDTGSGMDAEVLERATEPFFTTRRTALGLGLAAARGMSEGYGGRLDLESAPGEGCRARIWLPVIGGGADPVETV